MHLELNSRGNVAMLFGLIPREEAFFEQLKKAAHDIIDWGAVF